MKKDVTICIGTVGYPTFNKCYKSAKRIAIKDSRVKDIVVIKNKYPTSAWLNEMRKCNKTTWVLQVDEDMYLKDNCIDELISLAKRSEAEGITVLNASGLLFDLFLNSQIGSIKLWNTKCFEFGEFKDIKGSDRKFALDVSKFGFQNVEVHKVLGEHDSAPNPEIAFFKYKEYVEKIIKFNDHRSGKKFVKHLNAIRMKRGDIIGDYAYAGGIMGLRGVGPDSTKNFLNNKLNAKTIKDINIIIKQAQ